MARAARLALLAALLAMPALAQNTEPGGNFIAVDDDNAAQPELSEEGRVYTGQETPPLTPDNFATRMSDAIADAKAIASFMDPKIWAILIAGFGLVGFVIRRTEHVLKFDTEAGASRRTTPPEDRSAVSAPDASTPPHSDSDPAPSAPRAPVE